MQKSKNAFRSMTSGGQAGSMPVQRKKVGDSHCLTISVEEAARILGISRGTAYAHAHDGSLPTIRLGRRLLVPKAGLEKMLSVV
jgi:excisionase family DNA binding protein